MIKRVYLLSIISLLFLSTFVLAAGSSTANAQTNKQCVTNSDCELRSVYLCNGNNLVEASKECFSISDGDVVIPNCSNPSERPSGGTYSYATSCKCVSSTCYADTTSRPGEIAATCEDKVTLRERIKCRMENPAIARKEAYGASEEACRGHADATRSACENLYKNSVMCYNMSDSVEKKRCFLVASGVSLNAQGTFRAAPDDSKRNYVVLLLYDLQERIETMQEEGKITVDEASSLIAKIVEIKRMIIAGENRSDIVANIKPFKEEYRMVMAGAA